MTSPICTVNGSTTGNGVNVAKNSTVTIAIADTAGVKNWSLQCLSTDDHLVATNISAGLSINTTTKVATFTSPNVSDGAALIFESKVNGGLDINGRVDESLTTRFGVFVLTDTGNLRVGAFDETVEGSASFGWTAKFNDGIRAAAAGAVTPTVTGTSPIVVGGTPAARVVSIIPASNVSAGSMSSADKIKSDAMFPVAAAGPITFTDVSGTRFINIAEAGPATRGSMSIADKALLDAATDANTASTLAKRSAAGLISVTTLSAATAVETTSVYTESVSNPNGNLTFTCDGFGTITLDGAGVGELLVPMPIRSHSFKFDAQKNLSRSIPLNWSSCKVSTVDSWDIDDNSNIKCTVSDAFANLVIECRFVHGSHLTGITIRNRGPSGGTLPANPPTFSLYRKLLSTGVNSLVGTVNATLDGTYRGTSRDTLIDLSAGSGHIVDAELYRYFIVITPEYGSDALVGHIVYNAKVDYFLPSTFAIGMD